MIPHRAIFYWEDGGEGPSWLRRQSWASFARLNPTWKVEIISRPKESLISGDGLFSRVLRSDLARYEELADGGGYYFDTDIIFFKPMPEAWCDADVAVTMFDEGHIGHIAILGSSVKSPFFTMVTALAKDRLAQPLPLGYQSLGVALVGGIDLRGVAGQLGLKILALPLQAVLTVGWAEPQMCFAMVNGQHHWHPSSIGIHWYGGDHACRERELTATAENLMGTVLGKALNGRGV